MTACTLGSSSLSTTYTRWMCSPTICKQQFVCLPVGWDGGTVRQGRRSGGRAFCPRRLPGGCPRPNPHPVQQLAQPWVVLAGVAVPPPITARLQTPVPPPTLCRSSRSFVSRLTVNSWMSPLVGPPERLADAKKGCLVWRGGWMDVGGWVGLWVGRRQGAGGASR